MLSRLRLPKPKRPLLALGLRTALKGGLLTSHVAPLTAFALVMAFATVLALTGLISRRAGEATIILAAAAFMIQRLASHWRIRRARRDGRAAIGRLQSAAALPGHVRRRNPVV